MSTMSASRPRSMQRRPEWVETAGFVHRTACPVCESRNVTDLCALPFTQGRVAEFLKNKYPHAVDGFRMLTEAEYTLTACGACEAIFQRAAPNDALLKVLYEQWAEDPVDGFAVSRRKRGVAYFRKHADQIIDILTFLGRNPYELRVFDFAFGWGHWCRLVKGFGCTVYGTELSDKRRACADDIGIRFVPLEEIPNHSFDWINANQIFEHLPEPLEVLRILESALAPAGILTMAVPGGHDIRQKVMRGDWAAVFEPLMPLEHLNYYPRGCLAKMVARVGLRLVTVPERFVWRRGPGAFRQNVKAVLNPLGAPVSNRVFLSFQR
jgi:SAM-dependent methyltransferase